MSSAFDPVPEERGDLQPPRRRPPTPVGVTTPPPPRRPESGRRRVRWSRVIPIRDHLRTRAADRLSHAR
jgi:hypothetical protein